MPRRTRKPTTPDQKRKKRKHKRKPGRPFEYNRRLQQNARITGKRAD
jgi:hypothetical protein